MKILITGSNGLLGQKIVEQCIKRKLDFLATSKGENRNPNCSQKNYQPLDISNREEIVSVLKIYSPTHIINTAAVTNVDYCESNIEECQKVNVYAVRLLLEGAIQNNCHLIQLSTDFVFDGEDGPYKETDLVNPLSVYATSKADSEKLLIESNYKNWSILRTIIVFGQGENLSRSNIVLWAKSALEKKQTLTIVNDQFRAPTWAADLAWACIKTSELNAKGVFHISGPETFSIFDLVKRIGLFYGLSIEHVKPIKSVKLDQAAKRPPRTGFILDKAKTVLGYNPKTLEQSLKEIH